MSNTDTFARSKELMSRTDTALLVVDVQDKLLDLIPSGRRIVWNIGRLLEAARLLSVPIAASEQYPQRLGGTTAELRAQLAEVQAKRAFSCAACPELMQQLVDKQVSKVLVVGIETHVCVQQTVYDLMANGYRVYVAADAAGARFSLDHDLALRRMELGGATLTSTEAALFEWCETSEDPQFKQISALIRQSMPE